MARKKAQRKKQETALVPHRTLNLSALLERAKSGDSARNVQAYLAAGGLPTALVQVGEKLVPLLHSMACTNAHPHRELAESVSLLVAAGADIDALITDSADAAYTALMLAIGCNCCTAVQTALLSAGADPDVPSMPTCGTVLHLAAQQGVRRELQAAVRANRYIA
jgi:ankyrin repeat protein